MAKNNQLFGEGLFGDVAVEAESTLGKEFIVPPITVLDARSGYWQERKRAWVRLGLRSELGRDDVMGSLASARSVQTGGEAAEAEKWATTSIFDPTLCEIIYSWFSPEDGKVLDCFAGGSVRGIVCNQLGRKYTGVDLRTEQIEANRLQGADLLPGNEPTWIAGDSLQVIPTLEQEYDFFFSCPPYADLEVYSDQEEDISNMGYPEFLAIYRDIIKAGVSKLKDNRFACFVVGEARGKDGNYYNFVGDTIQAFLDAGCSYYNEGILITPMGTLPVRAGRQFRAGRKLGKGHQNVLVFVKGDAKQAHYACGGEEPVKKYTAV